MGFDLARRYGSAEQVLEVHAVSRAVAVPAIIDTRPAESLTSPYNAVTGVKYMGGNILRLLAAEAECDFGLGGWAGFKQWLSVGRVVRKGEHGTACITVVSVVDKAGKKGTRPRGFRVFHFDQTEALTADGVA